MTQREKMISYAIKYKGDYNKIINAIALNEDVEIIKCKNAFTILDDIYPKELLYLDAPPMVLFYKGDLSLLENSKCSIVGSRITSNYIEHITTLIVNNLKDKYTIVSGLAMGVDSICHRECLNNGKTIGVIGCGIDRIYPKINTDLYLLMAKNHLILSEYPSDVPPYKHHFPWRNRIIAALGKMLIVTAARNRSGTLITVNEAINLNKEIWVVPYHFDEIEGEGCNKLINDGANILLREYLDDL